MSLLIHTLSSTIEACMDNNIHFVHEYGYP